MNNPPQIVLLTTAHSYRNEAFLAAAQRLGIRALIGIDTPASFVATGPDQIALNFSEPAACLSRLSVLHATMPFMAIIGIDDSASLLAAHTAAALGLPHNTPQAAEAARNKYLMRQLLDGHVPIPHYQLAHTNTDLSALAQQIDYPCVVKPLELNGSRGVIRANTPAQFRAAVQRLTQLLNTIYGTGSHPFLIEEFIPGFEVALEGLLDNGQLEVLALFDKPDPLDGPFFEETIYVTPSRLDETTQASIATCTANAAQALGLSVGPIHAELRVNAHGPWLIEIAGRSIGGQCSRTLQFGTNASLEELILRQACRLPIHNLKRSGQAGGVMMLPIPAGGVLHRVAGIAAAQAVPGIESVTISIQPGQTVVPLPEGDSYLGFIFARAADPASVEAALRTAHSELHFTIMPAIMLG
jgi:biotin carboxylase